MIRFYKGYRQKDIEIELNKIAMDRYKYKGENTLFHEIEFEDEGNRFTICLGLSKDIEIIEFTVKKNGNDINLKQCVTGFRPKGESFYLVEDRLGHLNEIIDQRGSDE